MFWLKLVKLISRVIKTIPEREFEGYLERGQRYNWRDKTKRSQNIKLSTKQVSFGSALHPTFIVETTPHCLSPLEISRVIFGTERSYLAFKWTGHRSSLLGSFYWLLLHKGHQQSYKHVVLKLSGPSACSQAYCQPRHRSHNSDLCLWRWFQARPSSRTPYVLVAVGYH